MRLWPARRQVPADPVQPQAPPAEPRESARALAQSRDALRRERQQLVVPMQRRAQANNVTELVRALIREKGDTGAHGSAAG